MKAMKSLFISLGMVCGLIACFSYYSYDALNVCSSRISIQEIQHITLPDISSELENSRRTYPVFQEDAYHNPFVSAYDGYIIFSNGSAMQPVIFLDSEDERACYEGTHFLDEFSQIEFDHQDVQRILESCLGDARGNEAPEIRVYNRNSSVLATYSIARDNNSPPAGKEAIIAFGAGSIIVSGACTAQNKRIAFAGRLVAQGIIEERIAQANIAFAP